MKRPTTRTHSSPAEFERFGPPPRDVRLTSNGWALTVFAMLFAAAALAAALGLPLLRAGQQAARDRFERDSIVTDATILRVQTKKDGDNNRRREATVRYATPSGEYESTLRLPNHDRRAVAGGSLAISYLPSEPKRTWIAGAGAGPGVLALWVLPLIPMLLLLAGAGLAWAVRRERVLLSEGRFALARVISSKKVSHSHGHSHRVSYEFTTLSGAKVTATVNRNRPLAVDTTTVPVVYHRENARWNAVFPLTLATPFHK